MKAIVGGCPVGGQAPSPVRRAEATGEGACLPTGRRICRRRAYAALPLDEAITHAARALRADGKRCDHHWRTRDIGGLGLLYCYDTALRMGCRLRFLPLRVYLHSGTREGAIALGIDRKRQTVEIAELPPPFACLDAAEIEDALCIYKSDLARLFA
jgi:hypothetical protein